MDNNTKISIIVPIYNTVDYLERCLNSIINQTHKNLEIICIDDGSTDGSGELLDKIAATDSRIIAIHIPNGGVSNARNIGLERATGEFVGFVDSDDYIELDMYEFLYKKAIETDADMVQCDPEGVYDDVSKNKRRRFSENKVYEDRKEILKAFIIGKLGGAVWAKIWKSSIAKLIKFDINLTNTEDFLWIYEYCKKAEKIYTTDFLGYNYYQRDNSASKGIMSEKFFQLLQTDRIYVEENRDDLELYQLALCRYTCSCTGILTKIIKDKQCTEKYNELKKEILKNQWIVYKNLNIPLKTKLKIMALQISPKFYNWFYETKNKEQA